MKKIENWLYWVAIGIGVLVSVFLNLSGVFFLFSWLIGLGVVVLIIGVYFMITIYIHEMQTQKELKQEQYKRNVVLFYERCKSVGIKYPLNKENRKLAQNILEEFVPLPKDSLDELYEDGYIEKKRIEKQTDDNRMKALQLILSEGVKSKYVHDLSKTLAEHYETYASMKDINEKLLKLKTTTTAKKQNWAIAGGLAEGIGGAGLGVATALNVQRENMIAERNACQIRAEAYNALSRLSIDDQNIQILKKNMVKVFKNFDVKYSHNLNVQENVNVNYIVNNYSVLESGSLKVDMSPMNKSLDVQNVLDGLLYVTVKHNNSVVGEGYIISSGYLNNFDKKEGGRVIDLIGLERDRLIRCFPVNGHQFSDSNKYEFEFIPVCVWSIDIKELKSDFFDLCNTFDRFNREMQSSMRNAAVDALL